MKLLREQAVYILRIGTFVRRAMRMCCVCMLLLFIAPACGDLGFRPGNLPGQVHCQPVQAGTPQILLVQVVLNDEAVQHHSKLEVIREVAVPSTSSGGVSSLQVDVGDANGAVSGCSSFTGTAFRVTITDQMLSYPSWIRIRSRNPVRLIIQDDYGQDLVAPLMLEPHPDEFTVQWLR